MHSRQDTSSDETGWQPASAVPGTMMLYHFEACPHSRSIRLALGELGILVAHIEERTWDWRPEFLALNPAGEVPVLVTGDGDALCGAYAISEHLGREAAAMGARPGALPLFPEDPIHQAEVRRLVDWFHGKMHRDVTREMLQEKVMGAFMPATAHHPDPAVLAALRDNLRYHLSYIEHLADQRNWLAGEDLSFADFAAGAHLSLLDYLAEVPWEAFPHLTHWYQRLKSRPAFRPLLSARLAGIPPASSYANLDF